MKDTTKEKLYEAWAYCDENDKSTEYMLQLMQLKAGVDLDCVMNFIDKFGGEKRQQWYKQKLAIK